MNVKDLENRILAAKEAYYKGTPTMTDNQFDALEESLREIDPTNRVLHLVGSSYIASFKNVVEHTYPMLSQKKALTNEALKNELVKFRNMGTSDFFASGKLDGMSCSLHYENGELTRALTRGDGSKGVDITAKVVYCIPSTLPMNFSGEIRGELLLSTDNFKALNTLLEEAGETPYENPRNGVAGLINDSTITVRKIDKLSFVFFRMIKEDIGDTASVFFEEADNAVTDTRFAESLGFEVAEYKEFTYDTDSDFEEVVDYFIAIRDSYKYGLDGVVFRVLDNEEYERLGDASNYPLGSVAWKFASDYELVTITDIEWSVGTRDITPVAIFEPTMIGGAMIRKVSLKSVKNMVDKGVIIGKVCKVHRSGDVIPWLSEVVG